MGGQPGPAMNVSGVVDAGKSGNTLSLQSITPLKNVQVHPDFTVFDKSFAEFA